MKLTEHQLRVTVRSIIAELFGGKKKTSFLEDMLGHGSDTHVGYGGYGGHDYGEGDVYGDYDFYLEDNYGVDMGGDDYGDDGGDDGGE